MSTRELMVVALGLLTALVSGCVQSSVADAQRTQAETAAPQTLSQMQSAAAAARKSEGLMRYTTNDDRRAASLRAAARRAAHDVDTGRGR